MLKYEMMKKLFYVSLILIFSFLKSGATTAQSVLQGLALAENPERELIGVEIIESLEEEAWVFQFKDPNYKENHRWIKAHDTKILTDKAGFLPVFEGEPLKPLAEEDLKTEIALLKKKAREIAKVAEASPAEYRYRLKYPEHRKTAFWEIALLDHEGDSLGAMALDARTGKTVTASWQKAEKKQKMAQKSVVQKKASPSQKKENKENFGHSVEKTFRGVGADLEQFFTGKRTVDKD